MVVSFNGDEWLSIVRKLVDLTQRGLLIWGLDENAPSPDQAFTAHAPGGTQYLMYPIDFDERFPYLLSIWGDGTRQIGTFKTVGFDPEHFESPEEAASSLISDLYVTVQRLISGAPQTVQSLLSELESLDNGSTP